MGKILAMFLLGVFGVCTGLSGSTYFNRKTCGKELVKQLSLVCENGYYGPQDNKRSVETFEDLDVESSVNDVSHEDPVWWPFIGDRTQYVVMLRTRRGKQHGIVDECCHKVCTYDELRSYCK